MALFKKGGGNLKRAINAIAGTIGDKEKTTETTTTEEVVEETKVETVEEIKDTTTEETKVVEEEIKEVVDEVVVEETTTEEVTEIENKPVITEPSVPELTDEIVFNYLGEMLGKEIKSKDDLTIKEQKELDPELAQLLEWKEKTGLPLSKWAEYNKDFSKMEDLDVAREILSQKYPNLNKEELDFEMRHYVFNEEDDEDSSKIRKSVNLKKFAQEGRTTLDKNRLDLKESAMTPTLTQEQIADIQYAQDARTNSDQVIQGQNAYNESIKQEALSFTGLDLKLSEDLTIKYNLSDEQKRSLPKDISEMPHWYNEDGSHNHANIIKDGVRIKYYEESLQAAFEQGKAVGKEGSITKNNNINLDGKTVPKIDSNSTKVGNIETVVGNIIKSKGGSRLRRRNKKE